MSLKNLAIVAVVSCGLSAPVFAQNPAVGNTSFSALDTQQLFVQNSASVGVVPLSLDEMKSTEGAFAPWVVAGGIGAGVGAGSYIMQYAAGNQNWNWTHFGASVAGGAAGGIYTTFVPGGLGLIGGGLLGGAIQGIGSRW